MREFWINLNSEIGKLNLRLMRIEIDQTKLHEIGNQASMC